MSDDAAAGPRGLIVGNSYVGALIRAAADPKRAELGAAFDFAAAGGVNFARVAVAKGRVVNVRTREGGLLPLDAYAAIFIYADLPDPIELALIRRKLAKMRYSAQVIDLALRNAVSRSQSVAVRDRIRAATDRPVILLPGNPRAMADVIPREERTEMLKLIRAEVGEPYLPAPLGLLNADGAPKASLYKGSVGIEGHSLAEDAAAQQKHDCYHLNPTGGAIWLSYLGNALRKMAGSATD